MASVNPSCDNHNIVDASPSVGSVVDIPSWSIPAWHGPRERADDSSSRMIGSSHPRNGASFRSLVLRRLLYSALIMLSSLKHWWRQRNGTTPTYRSRGTSLFLRASEERLLCSDQSSPFDSWCRALYQNLAKAPHSTSFHLWMRHSVGFPRFRTLTSNQDGILLFSFF
jgi:hypothetical protein